MATKCCKSKMYIPKKEEEPMHILEPAKLNNIMHVSYSALLENKAFHTSSPTCCQSCSSALSMYSVLYSRENYLNKMTEDGKIKKKNDEERAKEEEKHEEPEFLNGKYIEDLREDEGAWICEYCGVHNRVPKDAKVPGSGDELYLLRRSTTQETQEEEKAVENPDINLADDTNLIFCIDVSGSMAETHTVSKDGKAGRFSRLKLVTEAVLKQIDQMKITYPNRKIGLVTFDTEVFLFGDCHETKLQVSGSGSFEQLLDLSRKKASTLLTKSLKNSVDKLVYTIKRLVTNSTTALGPALLCSLGLVQGKPGSRIILCTDGLANVGLGSLGYGDGDISEEAKAFYDRVGDVAIQSGVSISIITVEGNACRVDALGPVTDRTAGTILRVDPADMDLSDMAANSLIATNVRLRAIMHHGLAFIHEDGRNLQKDGSILVKDVGSVTANNEMYFEYRVKKSDDLKKLGVDIENMTFLPLQAQVSYTDLKGNEFVRILTKQQELTKDLEEADKEVDAPILTNFVTKATANLTLAGHVGDAKKKNREWTGYVSHVKGKGHMKEEDKKVIDDFDKENLEINTLVEQTEQKKNIGMAKRDDITSKLYKHVQTKK